MANNPLTLFTLPAPGPTLTAAAAASLLVTSTPVAGQLRGFIPANWIGYGTRITVDAYGVLTSAASSQGTGTFDVRMGPSIPTSIIVANGGSPTLTASMASWKWQCHFDMTLRIVGAGTAAQFFNEGWMAWGLTATTETYLEMPYNVTPPVLGTGFDATVPNYIDVFWTPSAGTATLICHAANAVIWNPNY